VLNGLLVKLELLFELRIHHLPHRFGMRRSCTNTLTFQRLMLMGRAARFSLASALCRLPGASHFGESSRAYWRRQRNSGHRILQGRIFILTKKPWPATMLTPRGPLAAQKPASFWLNREACRCSRQIEPLAKAGYLSTLP